MGFYRRVHPTAYLREASGAIPPITGAFVLIADNGNIYVAVFVRGSVEIGAEE
jgi:hypothetical protein